VRVGDPFAVPAWWGVNRPLVLVRVGPRELVLEHVAVVDPRDAFTQEALWEIGSTLTFSRIRNHVAELAPFA
jgi:hypothetical protein